MKKRVLSALLVLCMACSMVSTVWATETNATSGAPEPASQTLNLDNEQSGNENGADSTGAPSDSTSASSDSTSSGSSSAASDATSGATSGEGDESAASSEVVGSEGTSTPSPTPTLQPESTEEPAVTPSPEPTLSSVQSVQSNQAPAANRAPAARASVTVENQIKETGRLVASVTGAGTGEFTYTWYRKADNGSFEEVTPVKVTGEEYNAKDNWLNVALDIESLCDNVTDSTQKNAIRSRQYTYYVVVKQDGQQVGQSQECQVPYYAQLLNGSFEDTPIVWQTTASDGAIEIGSYTRSMDVYGTTDDKSSSDAGTNFAELNANAAGALYQDVLTVPGANLTWELAHRARNAEGTADSCFTPATDTMYVVIMSTQDAEKLLAGVSADNQQTVLTNMINSVLNGQESVENKSYTLQQGSNSGKTVKVTVTKVTTTSELDERTSGWWPFQQTVWSSSGQWKTYDGTYKVPQGQYATRFFFAAGNTQTGNPTVGNLIDEVWFSPELPPPDDDEAQLTVAKTVTGLSEEEMADYSVTLQISASGADVQTVTFSGDDFQPDASGSYTASRTFNYTVQANTGSKTVTVSETQPQVPGYTVGTSYAVTGAAAQNGTGTQTEQFTIPARQNATVTFTNTYTPTTGTLTITKVMDGWPESAILSRELFEFTITGAADFEQIIKLPTQSGTVNGEYWTTQITLPAGTYTVEETDWTPGNGVYGYVGTTVTYEGNTDNDTKQESVAVTAGQDTRITFTNKYEPITGSLTIEKEVTGLTGGANADDTPFRFTITGPSGMFAEGETSKTFEAVDAEGAPAGGVTFNNGSDGTPTATVTITGEGSLKINGLPLGTYTVQETSAPDIGDFYCELPTSPQSSTISNAMEGELDQTVTITNTYKPYLTLDITKSVTGEMGSSEDYFDFTLTGVGCDQYELKDAQVTQTPDANFKLNNGSTVTLTGLKPGDEITILETLNNGYTFQGVTVTSGTLTEKAEGNPNGDYEKTANGIQIIIPEPADDTTALGTVTFNNHREAVAPTGLESNHTTPYVLMITAAGMAGLALIGGIVARRIRRRRQE